MSDLDGVRTDELSSERERTAHPRAGARRSDMTAQLVQATAVIAATNFNPTVFNQVWLATHQIVPPPSGDPLPGSIFTDVLVQAQAPDFMLVVMPQQLHLVPRTASAPGQLVVEPLQRIVALLPETPYVAVGLNFVWQSAPLAELGPIVRRLFAAGHPPFNHFDSADARFGTYASRDVGLARLRLDVRPIHDLIDSQVERLQFAFNFERDLKCDAEKPARIVDVASRWEEYRELAGGIVSSTMETVA
jgi:hypothetical protein